MSDGASDQAAGDPPTTPVSAGTPRPRSPFWAAARRRATELLVVFVGVYAAFLLNRFDTDRRDAKRRQQILGSLEREIDSSVQDYRKELAQSDVEFGEFDAQLARGEMPPLGIIFNNSGYSATDDAALLQAGGLELLDVQTLDLLRKANALERSLGATMHNQFELSLTELTNHAPEDFYDPATHQLKKLYQWYPRVLHMALAQGKEILAVEEELLAHIRAERHPGASPAASPTPVPSPADRTTPSRSPAPPTPAA